MNICSEMRSHASMIPVGHSWCGVRFRYADLFSRLLPQLGLLNGAFERVQGPPVT